MGGGGVGVTFVGSASVSGGSLEPDLLLCMQGVDICFLGTKGTRGIHI